MEKAMRLSLTVMTGLLVIGGAAAAEPPKKAPVEAPKPIQSESRPATIMLASADAVRVSLPDGPQSTPASKRRIAPRVTGCRCGDPQIQPDPQDQ
jgi:hypothetical protein